MSNYGKESGHWYYYDGKPCYEVESKNGKMRAATIRDARKLNLYPSVTTILKVLPKPALDNWKINQGIMSALTSPHMSQYTANQINEQDLLRLIKEDAQEEAKQAAEVGTKIHAAIEKYFTTGEKTEGYSICLKNIKTKLKENNIDTDNICFEKTFCSEKYKFGGKIDLCAEEQAEKLFVIDFKTKDFIEEKEIHFYPEQLYQLIAYGAGFYELEIENIKELRLINIAVSRRDVNKIVYHEWSNEDYYEAWDIFTSAHDLWKKLKKFN